MRVLALTNLYPPHAYGGYEWTCFDTMLRFREEGHDVAVLTSDVIVDGVGSEEEANVSRTLEPWWDWRWQTPIASEPRAVLRRELRNLARLRRALDEARPDVVSVWHMGGIGLSLLAEVEDRRLPMVVVIEDDWLVYGPQRDPWRTVSAAAPLLRLAGRLSGIPRRAATLAEAQLVFASSFTRDRATAAGSWDLAGAVVEPLGVDTRAFPLTQPEDKQWEWRILYVGRMEPQKGVDTLLRAFALLPAQARLTILGGGNEGFRESMVELSRNLGVAQRVAFGVCPRGELAPAYRGADVVAFPSEWDEPFGIVPLEAMACGVPVVATGTGGSAEFLEDSRNCLLFNAGDADELAAALHRLAKDRPLRRRLLAGGADTAERLTADRFSSQMAAVHSGLAARGRGYRVGSKDSTGRA